MKMKIMHCMLKYAELGFTYFKAFER